MLGKLISPLFAVTILLGVAACSTPAASAEGSEPSVSISENTIVLDVRTPGEYAQGHLDGAVLLDLNGGQFAEALPSLDPDAEYVVYCRSGNRSGQAIALMQERGITNTTNAGSVEQASEVTGIPIVTR